MKTTFYYKIMLVSFCLLCYALAAMAQVEVQWDKTFGGSREDQLTKAIYTPDRGYLLAGWSSSPASGDKSEDSRGSRDYWIVKIDKDGSKQWDKTFGGSDGDHLFSAISTKDEGYLLAGYSGSDASGDKSEDSKGGWDYWIVKIDEEGNKQWDKTFGGSSDDVFTYAIQTADEGYLLGGFSPSPASGDKSEDSKGDLDYWIIKIDAQGNKEWDKTFGGSDRENLKSVISIPDGGYLLAGSSLIKIDAEGNKQWEKAIGADIIINSLNGGYLLAGSSVIKIDDNGNIQWKKNIIAHSAVSSPDGSYLIGIGELGSYTIMKIDEEGNKLWDKTFGGSSYEELTNVILNSEGGYLLAGSSISDASGDKTENSKGGYDYWIIKIVETGEEVPFSIQSLAFVDAETDEEIQTLQDGDIIDLATLSGSKFSIVAKTGGSVNDGLVAHYPFTKPASGDANQVTETVNGYHGTLSGGTYTADRKGVANSAIFFDGESDYISVSDFDFDHQELTLSVWVKPDQVDKDHPQDIISKHTSPGDVEMLVRLESDERYDVEWTIGDSFYDLSTEGENDNDEEGLITPSYTTFDHLVATYDGSSIRLYVNGKLIKERQASGEVHDNDYPIVIGNHLSYGEAYQGVIDDVMIFERGLSKAEVMNLHDAVGSVAFSLRGTFIHGHTENYAPYALFGDNPKGDFAGRFFPPGAYTFTATPYEGKNKTGATGPSKTVQFIIINSDEIVDSQVTGFDLYDAVTDQKIMDLMDGAIIHTDELSHEELTVLMHTVPDFVGSVKVELWGPLSLTRIENTKPYALFRNNSKDLFGEVLPAGAYHLKATPYTQANAQGASGEPLAISFTVEGGDSNNERLAAYPVPTTGVVHISYQGSEERTQMMLLDFSGQPLLNLPLKRETQLDLSTYRKGIYYLKVVDSEGVQLKRLVVE